MTTSIRVSARDLPNALLREGERHAGALKLAARAAVFRLKSYMVKIVDASGITDRGIYKNSFRATDNALWNDAAHAGIIELGTRPHKVSEASRLAIKSWCMRKLGLDEVEAERASWAIAKHHEKYGTAPHYFFRDSLPMARLFYAQELERIINSSNAKG